MLKDKKLMKNLRRYGKIVDANVIGYCLYKGAFGRRSAKLWVKTLDGVEFKVFINSDSVNKYPRNSNVAIKVLGNDAVLAL